MKYLILLLISITLAGCASEPYKTNPQNEKEESNAAAQVTDDLPPPPSEVTSAHFTAVGDLLVERPILYDARQEDGSFMFDQLLGNVDYLIKKGDFSYANQETPITGAEFGLGDGDFVFNNPYELGHSFYRAGFNMLQLANNHTLDMEVSGLDRNVDFWRTNYPDVLLSGVYTSIEEQNAIPIIERNGISIALISSTYSSNKPVELEYSINIFTENEDKLLQDVARANEMADLVAVGIHWGKEYQQPTIEQEELADKLASQGADIIIGHHPHVLQPIEWIEGKNGSKTLVAYSLGNFISGPFDDRVPELDCPRLTGAILGFDLSKENDSVDMRSVYAIPTFTSFSEEFSSFTVLPLDEFDQQDFRWCDLSEHKQYVNETLTERMNNIEIRMDMEPK
ncbi:CapA family protein [Jeotgalibacillus sp. S-D1]|uniref:CapA family protein n=1 Tax=Jeotgalibacillus sp. S-D1 TaxID=2552189 RepID=UPI001059DAD2|nr:CapA family protein [Jeotgalibacillus sp. S-D1]TDL31443.1 CapA family protein [Jeotgalibacillus sp. S-D1]